MKVDESDRSTTTVCGGVLPPSDEQVNMIVWPQVDGGGKKRIMPPVSLTTTSLRPGAASEAAGETWHLTLCPSEIARTVGEFAPASDDDSASAVAGCGVITSANCIDRSTPPSTEPLSASTAPALDGTAASLAVCWKTALSAGCFVAHAQRVLASTRLYANDAVDDRHMPADQGRFPRRPETRLQVGDCPMRSRDVMRPPVTSGSCHNVWRA